MAICTSVYSQSIKSKGIISGSLVNEDQEPIVYATIGLLSSKDSLLVKGSITDEEGNFVFENVAFGSYLLEISHVGYKKFRSRVFTLNEAGNTINEKKIILEKSGIALDAVTVTAQSSFIEKRSDKTVLNIEKSVLSAGNTALEILRRAPGVNVDNFGNISLRGRQGILVMINGKSTFLNSEELLTLLRTTDGNSIGTIELIPNPSSKYDASGSSGIINIKLKKNRSYGTNGNIGAGVGYGEDSKTNTSLSLNHRNEKVNIHGSYNFSNNNTLTILDLLRENVLDDEVTFFDQNGDSRNRFTNNSYKAGIDWFINEKNTLGLTVNGQSNRRRANSISETFISSQPNIIDSTVITDNPLTGRFSNLAYNLNFITLLDTLGQEINVDLDYGRYRNRRNNNFNNTFFDASGQPQGEEIVFRNISPTDIDILSAKIDYSYAFSEDFKLETGLKSSLVETDNDFRFENLINGQFVNDTQRSNQFIYRENVNAAYISLSKNLKKLTLQGGLRAEQTNSEANSITQQVVVDRSFLDFFPSLAINLALTENNAFGFNYNRRIDRADYAALNPFTEFVDLFTFEQGNPFLNPQYTNSFELSWTYKDTYSLSLGYSKTNDVISDVFLSDPINSTLAITSLNLAEKTSYNISLNVPIAIAEFWNTDNNFTVFQNDFETPNIMGLPFNSSQLSLQFSSYHAIKISPTISAELSGFYVSSQVVDTYKIDPITAIDFGIDKSFAKGKGSIKFSVSDIFNTNIVRLTSEIPLLNYNLDQKEETRIFRLGVSYKFGSSDVKGPRSRSKGSSNEENRVREN